MKEMIEIESVEDDDTSIEPTSKKQKTTKLSTEETMESKLWTALCSKIDFIYSGTGYYQKFIENKTVACKFCNLSELSCFEKGKGKFYTKYYYIIYYAFLISLNKIK